MSVLRRIIVRALPAVFGHAGAGCASRGGRASRAGLSPRAEQRTAIADGHAIPLAVARRMLRQKMGGELVRARLCHETTASSTC